MNFFGVMVVNSNLKGKQTMNRISAIWQLFKAGQSVADPARWKSRQITVTVLGAVILAAVNLLTAFGMSIPVDMETANAIAGGIIAVVNVVLTITTTEKIGISDSLTIETNDKTNKDSNNRNNDTDVIN